MTVLIVDDDPAQLETLSRGLFLLGIEHRTARDLAGALAQLDGIDLLLTDVTRACKPGGAIVARARAARPGLRVLVITGLALTAEGAALRARGIPILRRPFTFEQLGQAIESLLGK